jgi:uncharacterized membrane protein (UPF0127 family)
MIAPSRITIVNATKHTTVGAAIDVADAFRSRIIGLLGRRRLDPGEGLLITPCSGIHTWGMRFPLDVVALDSAMRVLKVRENLGSFRIAAVGWKTRRVLELPVGTIRGSGIEIGDQLVVSSPPAQPTLGS